MTNQTKRTLLSLTGLGIFLVLAFGSEYSTNKNSSNGSGGTDTRTTSKDTTTYTNSKSGLTGNLEENYVDFSFDYPSKWKRDTTARADSPNFIKVENQSPEAITIENFAVGYCTGPLTLMPKLAEQLSEQFAGSGNFPEYKKVSDGPTKVAGLDAYEFRFTGHSAKEGKDLDIWGRAILLPSTSARKGAVLIMLATSASPDVHGVDDVGVKGELPTILASFKLGG